MSEPTYDEKKDQVVQSVIGMFKMLTEGMTSTEQVGCRDAVIYWLGKAVGEGRAIPDNPLDKELREVREVLAKAMERLDDGSAWADDSDEFRHMCDVSGYVRR